MSRTASTVALVAGVLVACAPAAASWTEPRYISPRHGYTYMSDLAVAPNGDVAGIGETYTKPDGLVAYASHDRQPFEGEEVNDSTDENAYLSFDREGGLVVLSHRSGFGDAIRVYTREPGGRFGAERVLDPGPGDPTGIVTSPAGEVLALWTTEGRRRRPLHVAVRPATGGRFGAPRALGEPGLGAGGPRVLFDRRGNALLAWEADGRLAYSLRPRGGEFGPERVLASPADRFAHDYGVAANRDGQAVAVWRGHPGRRRVVRAAFGSVAGGFGAPRRIGGASNRGPYAAVDRDGGVIAAWRAAGEPSFELRAALAPAGSGRFGASRVLAKGYVDPGGVAADGRGTTTVAWLEGRTLKAARHRPGKGAFSEEVVGESNVRGASLATTADGRTVLAWKAFARGGTKRVKAAVARPRHSFGAVATLARFGRTDSVTGPGIAVGPDGGAFAWWEVFPFDDESIAAAGSWLLP